MNLNFTYKSNRLIGALNIVTQQRVLKRTHTKKLSQQIIITQLVFNTSNTIKVSNLLLIPNNRKSMSTVIIICGSEYYLSTLLYN